MRPQGRNGVATRVGFQKYTVTLKLHFVTKEDRRQIAEVAWAAINDAIRFYGPDVRSGEVVDITPDEPGPVSRLRKA
jgi:hypothetical protein